MSKRMLRRAISAVALLCGVSTGAVAQMPGMPDMPMGKDMRWNNTLFLLFDQLEYAPDAPGRPVEVEFRGWYGGAHRRLWLRAQGEMATTARDADGEVEVLFGRLVDPFWDAVIGVHVDQHWGGDIPTRTMLAVGLVGLAPYRFELEPTLYVTARGEVAARLGVGFPLLLTQRLIAEPEAQFNASLQAVPRYELRRGLNNYEIGVRVRYEFIREIAPYAGVSRSRRFGVGAARTDEAQWRFVAGMRLWR